MTKQESFKRRIRARMATTGERYTAARLALLSESGATGSVRTWVAPPEMSDAAVRNATGHGWDHWCDTIESWPGHQEGHTAIARHLEATTDLDGWWSQSVTVGYERITGLRLPYQRADGTFTAGRSRTITADAGALRSMLIDDDHRSDLFPGWTTALRSKPGAKAIRVEIGPGVATIGITDVGGGRVKVTVGHDRLPHYDLVEEWKFFWGDWLEALDTPT
jgi:hypothetical protein